jgi:hypothetical protein
MKLSSPLTRTHLLSVRQYHHLTSVLDVDEHIPV